MERTDNKNHSYAGEYKLTISDMKDCCGKPFDTAGCSIVLVQQGYGIVKVNSMQFPLKEGSIGILFYNDNVVFENVSNGFKAGIISLPYNLIEDIVYKVTTSRLWNFIDANPFFQANDRQLFLLKNWWQQMSWTINHCTISYRKDMLKNHIHNLFMAIDTELQLSGLDDSQRESNRARMLVNQFLELLAKHHSNYREVQFYADKLCIATSYLYKVTSRVLAASPKELIDKQVVVAIKEMLINTDLSVKSIASELHFKDPSYMCRFFTRMTGVSPINYRIKT
ncbi:helix-turn-helix domain-containing protein [Dysgonomonas sp. BGC7]|uniref:helix-turn-helix domain-containing protein n=1 Tax=Dysgonomonas sp. BGC7 TaxID=1658008 RepID=UPI0006806421|nr:helix-turn-helix domain-containing protein [Dysgonomonas sp. BGC7]MBD8388871.1 helix-turn-helix domain-containing protein [Dysgonomonas sp. BGC7]